MRREGTESASGKGVGKEKGLGTGNAVFRDYSFHLSIMVYSQEPHTQQRGIRLEYYPAHTQQLTTRSTKARLLGKLCSTRVRL